MRWRLYQPVAIDTRTARGRIFILLALRGGIATVVSQTSWTPYRVPQEVLRPVAGMAGRPGESGVGDPAVTGSAHKTLLSEGVGLVHLRAPRPVRSLAALGGAP